MEDLTFEQVEYYIDGFIIISFLIGMIGFAWILHRRIEEIDVTDVSDEEWEDIFKEINKK